MELLVSVSQRLNKPVVIQGPVIDAYKHKIIETYPEDLQLRHKTLGEYLLFQWDKRTGAS